MADDIAGHADIYSTPSKRKRSGPNQPYAVSVSTSRRSSPTKKTIVETIPGPLAAVDVSARIMRSRRGILRRILGRTHKGDRRRIQQTHALQVMSSTPPSPLGSEGNGEDSGDALSTPSKKSRPISKEHDFTSPLKKVIMSNLQDYKDNASFENFTLNRNFKPTPVPTKKQIHQNVARREVPSFLDGFEGYFDQKKTVKGFKISKNNMSMAPEVTREEYAIITNVFHKYFHKKARSELFKIQQKLFPQYYLELSQGFSLLFYGVGSKREFLEKFAIRYLPHQIARSGDSKTIAPGEKGVPCIVINGYNPTCNYRDVSKEISEILSPEELTRSETKYWGNHVLLHIQKMIEFYKTQPPTIKLVIIVHNLDGPAVRKDVFQTMFSYLAKIRQIALVASVDHIYAPILWDNKKAQDFNFVFHDVTNYEPNTVESSFQDVTKMGKNNKSSGAEGAKYVLQSLTSNSKKMYKLLAEAQLQNMQADRVGPTKLGQPAMGLEFKRLLQLCSSDFIASNEISLRSILTEFVEHKMASLSKNLSGTEYVFIPYSYAEIKKLVETVLKDMQ